MAIDRAVRSEELFRQGYNCAQAVLLSFLDVIPIDEKTAAALASPFGGGMGLMRETCGAFTGSLLVLGLLRGNADPRDRSDRKRVYADAQQLGEYFLNRHGSLCCGELLGLRKVREVGPGKPPLKKEPCSCMVSEAVHDLQEMLGL